MAFRFKKTLIALAAVGAFSMPVMAATTSTPSLTALLAAYKTGNVANFQKALASVNPISLANEIKGLSTAQLTSLVGKSNAALLQKDLANATNAQITAAAKKADVASLAQIAINDPSAAKSGQMLTTVTQQAASGQPITGKPVSP